MIARTIVAGVMVAVASSAAAATTTLLDFTAFAPTAVKPAITGGSIGGLNYTLTTAPADQSTLTPFDANPNSAASFAFCQQSGGGPLACLNDGLGVGNSEITNTPTDPALQAVNIEFDGLVRITKIYFFDLYQTVASMFDPTDSNKTLESALVSVGGGLPLEIFASVPFDTENGYHAESVSLLGTMFNFRVGEGNDNVGARDYALAAIEFEVIPLPASAALFLTGLAGLGLIGRRRKAA